MSSAKHPESGSPPAAVLSSPRTAPEGEAVGTLQLLRFAYSYMTCQQRVILVSGLFMACATLLSISIPALAEEIVSYGMRTITKTIDGVSHTAESSSATSLEAATAAPGLGVPADGAGAGADRLFFLGLGPLSERIFKPLLPMLFAFLRGAVVGDGTESVASLSPYVEGVLCRCLLMAVAILCYHFTSLVAHLAAYYAGSGAQNALTKDSVQRILHTPRPERVAVVNAVKLAQLITASGRALSDTTGELLTNVLSQVMYIVGFFAVMLFLSYQLTLTILVGVVGIQCLFVLQGISLHRQGSRVTAEEASVQAYIANILQRSQTVLVFGCSEFVLDRMADRSAQLWRLTNGLNRSIHGYAAVSSGLTRLILVVALGLSNYYQQKGQLGMRHTILYFACFQSLVNTLASLSSAVSQLRATLGRLKTLEAMLRWYSEPLADTAGEGCTAASELAVVDVQESATADVALDHVSFSYPAVPAFFSEVGGAAGAGDAVASWEQQLGTDMGSQHSNGVSEVSLTALIGGITVLYGPSGCGKSTCLRLLCGLVRPHTGTVRTQRRALLLEQQHAIFIGTVAENILLTNLSSFGSSTAEASALKPTRPSSGALQLPTAAATFAEMQRRVTDAAVKSGCANFLSNPFSTFIESVDHPQFSGGQLQRIVLARMLARTDNHSLVLLDEPTTGLDRSAVEVLLEAIKELRDTHHKTILISTHDHRVAEVADKVIDLSASAAEAQ
ncbi:ABC transporter-like protein [Leishmania major strain Friedlin]|uniref:ABC transporter-like protein n=1 Tax=Leishmania major TaxID=5664 RepID=Q4Q570_LEIMA|nr:ABC transporter-like protein [Leishmania major strain Friedlin]CAG9580339.1 ABC_transporter-like_protein [Leishmania major strain Friedlin]CAJ08732.1 ABC transporter-like protein [Leishmania major strain Friedlin]|eukprot:XP_001685528.1 ABC transporter-like protein [Leishmania major strain Friedlin]